MALPVIRYSSYEHNKANHYCKPSQQQYAHNLAVTLTQLHHTLHLNAILQQGAEEMCYRTPGEKHGATAIGLNTDKGKFQK